MTTTPQAYLDHASSAPLLPEARDAVLRALDAGPGNASSAHASGRRLRSILSTAREAVAALVGARPEQVVFTSGATESNRLAIRGLLAAARDAPLVLTTAAHGSLRALGEALHAEGREVRVVPAGPAGHVDAGSVAGACGEGSPVIALPLVQSETGAIAPVGEIARLVAGARLHVDAAQAAGRLPLDLAALGAATLSLSGHKIGAPHGIGALIVRDDAALRPPDGPATQERGRRAGTEAVALAAGLGAAARVVAARLPERAAHDARVLAPLHEMVRATPDAALVSRAPCAPGIVLVRFAGCPGDMVVAALDAVGIRVSTGTACASGARTPPRVLVDAGWGPREAAECVRVSVGRETREDDVERLVGALRDVVPRVRGALRRPRRDGEKKLS